MKYNYNCILKFAEEFSKLNAKNELPVLQIDDLTLVQSIPIIEYLDEKIPEPSLLPKDLGKRAKARAIAEIVNSGIQPYQNTNVI
jgi:glutathione S-transferase